MLLSKKFASVLFAGALLLGACADEAGDTTTESEEAESEEIEDTTNQENLHFEVVAKGFQHQFWSAVNEGAEEAAEEFGLSINFTGPANETAIQEQNQMLSNAVNQDPDAIVLASLDTEAQIDLIEQALNAEIPIIGFDSGVPDAPEGAIVANASTDNFAAAELGAEHVFEAVQDQVDEASIESPVRFGVVSQEVNSLSIRSRTEGFMERIEELVMESAGYDEGDVAVVGHDRYINDVSEGEARVIIELQVPTEASDAAVQTSAQTLYNKDDLIAIFGTNELGANGVVNANQATGNRLEDDVIGAGFDAGGLQVEAVRTGILHGAVAQDPVSIGYTAIELAHQHIIGDDVEDVDTGAVWYNQDNVDDEDISILLYE